MIALFPSHCPQLHLWKFYWFNKYTSVHFIFAPVQATIISCLNTVTASYSVYPFYLDIVLTQQICQIMSLSYFKYIVLRIKSKASTPAYNFLRDLSPFYLSRLIRLSLLLYHHILATAASFPCLSQIKVSFTPGAFPCCTSSLGLLLLSVSSLRY